MKQNNSAGFTIIELMIATSVLAMLLLLIATVSLQIGKLFYKGVSSSRTQETVRDITTGISRNIQYTSGTIQVLKTPTALSTSADPAGTLYERGAVCVGQTRYWYAKNKKVSGNQHALWVDNKGSSSCVIPTALEMNPASGPPSSGGRELVASGMQLSKFNVENLGTNPFFWSVDAGVALGDAGGDDIFTHDSDKYITGCVSSNQGGQFCDVAELKLGVNQWR